jgi:hypothetical protein
MTANEPTPNSSGLRLGSFDQIRGIIDEELEAVWAGDKTLRRHSTPLFNAVTSCCVASSKPTTNA